MNARRMAVALALVACIGAAQAGRQAPLLNPERVLLPVSQSAENIRTAIIAGGQQLGWVVVNEAPGKLTLKYNKQGKHEAVIDAVFDAQGYQLMYVDSTNLNYGTGSGGPEIHPNYNRWIANLIKHIGQASNAAQK